MPEITMPRLSDTMSEGTVSRWLKKEGDQVNKGDILAEIETDKATMELEAFESGTLVKIVQPEGATVAIGEPIAVVAKEGEDVPEASEKTEAKDEPSSTTKEAPREEGAQPPMERPEAAQAPAGTGEGTKQDGAEPVAEQPRSAQAAIVRETSLQASEPERPRDEAEDRIKASPLARRVAQELGVRLDAVTGTGPGGRIVKEDVENYHERQPAAASASTTGQAPTPTPRTAAPSDGEEKPDVEYIELSRMQNAVARNTTESKTKIPHFTVTSAIDMDAAAGLRNTLNEALGGEIRISYNDLVLKAVALALQKYPEVNGSFRDNKIVLNHRVHVGFATAIPGGLVVPVIRDCDKKSLKTIATETKALTEKVRAGRIHQSDIEGSTFNLSNMGMFDVEHFEAIITPPNAAVLAVGSIKQEPVVKDGQLAIGTVMRVTLSCDHRVFYGATAAQFLQEFKRIIENPMNLIL